MKISKVGDKYKLKGLSGLHDIGPLRYHVRAMLLDGLIPSNAENLILSQSSLSVYFTYKGRKYRISDHFAKFDGIQLIV